MSNIMWSIPRKRRCQRVGSAGLVIVLFLTSLPGCATEQPTVLTSRFPPVAPPGSFPLNLQPEPAPVGPAAAEPVGEYRIGIGDLLEVSVFRQNVQENDDLRRQLMVRPDGKVSYFFIGDVQAAGLTVEELRREITNRLSAYIRSPEVAVIPLDIKTRVYVVGEVTEQGVRELRPGQGEPILEAISQSKGLTKKADVDRAYVIRRNALIQVNLGDVLFRGDRSKSVALQSEDVLYIPEVLDQRIFVVGYLKQPNAFEIARPIRLIEAIALAGDFSLGAKKEAVKIIRGGLPRGSETPEVITVNVENVLAGVSTDPYVQRGDIVFVPATALGTWNEVMTQLLPTISVLWTGAAWYSVFRHP